MLFNVLDSTVVLRNILRVLFRAFIAWTHLHTWGLREFSKVLQTLDCFSGLVNYLEFSDPLLFRWGYVNTEKSALLLKCKLPSRNWDLSQKEFVNKFMR